MLTLLDQLNHLRKLGFNGNLKEISKMYQGLPFNEKDSEYLKLVGLSRKLCREYSELLSIPTKHLSQSEVEALEKQKKYLNALFCNQADYIFACCPYPNFLIGSVKLNSLAYINREFTVKPGTTLIIGRDNTPATNLVMIANKCTFGAENTQTKSKEITVGDDVWICAGVNVKNGIDIGDRSLIALGASVENDIKPDFISGGVPCKELKQVDANYKSKNHLKMQRSDEEILKILRFLNTLGFNGDMTEYIKLLNGENYNCLESTMIQISNFTHEICTEYNSPYTTKKRREEIIDVLFPFRGKDFNIGNNIYMDYIGCCEVGSGVVIGDNVSLAGNIKIGDFVKIEDDCIIQGIGHEVYYKNRRLQELDNKQLVELCTSVAITINGEITLEKGTYVSPNTVISANSKENTTILPNEKVIEREERQM